MNTIIIIDQNPKDRIIAESLLRSTYNIKSYTSLAIAKKALPEFEYSKRIVILADSKTIQRFGGAELIKKLAPSAKIILALPKETFSACPEKSPAEKKDSTFTLYKPYDCGTFLKTIRLAFIRRNLADSNKILHIAPDILGNGTLFDNLRKRIALYAASNAPVLILGESGTGKELAASAIHRYSRRCHKRFIPLDCASMPKELVESSLFGTTKGAYTDAIDKPGAFEEAYEGTVFLDEIGELNQEIQVKFLRTLESKSGSRLGSHEQLSYDFRLISATNIDLYNNGCFRPELLHRINTLVLKMPPLREHKEDIPALVKFFISKRDKVKFIDDSALKKLLDWHWPGNVRELKNITKRAFVLSGEESIIRASHIEIDKKGVYKQAYLF